LLNLLRLGLWQQCRPQELERTPEPDDFSDQEGNVRQYDQVMATPLALQYACGLEVIHRARQPEATRLAADLACGPGHYTLCLARHLNYREVVGIDLSSRMLALARDNAEAAGLGGRVRFRPGDVTRLEDVPSGSFDLTTFTNAAHHLPDLRAVARVLREMDRITRPGGLVMVMDLGRLCSAALTEAYVTLTAGDYPGRGLDRLLEDFRHSMHAAWTVKELARAIPRDTGRSWCQLATMGLPALQIVLGLPVGRRQVFVRSGLPWEVHEHPVPREWFAEWSLVRRSIRQKMVLRKG
jgi:ubiquinone/menaquinone biosynthesis C-methylase UbiE